MIRASSTISFNSSVERSSYAFCWPTSSWWTRSRRVTTAEVLGTTAAAAEDADGGGDDGGEAKGSRGEVTWVLVGDDTTPLRIAPVAQVGEAAPSTFVHPKSRSYIVGAGFSGSTVPLSSFCSVILDALRTDGSRSFSVMTGTAGATGGCRNDAASPVARVVVGEAVAAANRAGRDGALWSIICPSSVHRIQNTTADCRVTRQ